MNPDTEIDDLHSFLDVLPPQIRERLLKDNNLNSLIEVVLDLGRKPQVRFADGDEEMDMDPISFSELGLLTEKIGSFGNDNRAGVEKTLHRFSAIRARDTTVIGVTCRVGRSVEGTTKAITDLVNEDKSMLLLGRPGVGKTTILRELARVLSVDLSKRVIIVDTSNEIGGDGFIPHPGIGKARRMQVARPELQHDIMIEAVENHMPEVIIIDEMGKFLEFASSVGSDLNLFQEIDGVFPGRGPEPTPYNLEELSSAVINNNANLGIAFEVVGLKR